MKCEMSVSCETVDACGTKLVNEMFEVLRSDTRCRGLHRFSRRPFLAAIVCASGVSKLNAKVSFLAFRLSALFKPPKCFVVTR